MEFVELEWEKRGSMHVTHGTTYAFILQSCCNGKFLVLFFPDNHNLGYKVAICPNLKKAKTFCEGFLWGIEWNQAINEKGTK